VARLHSYIRLSEEIFHFPGCRTVIASGFRRPFILNGADDFLAANFSFSNAYIASERHLHGGALFLDNNIIQLLSANVFYRNILRYGSFIVRAHAFDVFEDHEDVFSLKQDYVRSEVIPVELFRKQYWFQEMNPRCLPHLQRVGWLNEYLKGDKPSASSPFLRLLRAVQTGPSDEELREKRCSRIPLILAKDDIEEDIQILSELMALGHSPILDALNEKKQVARWSSLGGLAERNPPLLPPSFGRPLHSANAHYAPRDALSKLLGPISFVACCASRPNGRTTAAGSPKCRHCWVF